MTPTSAARADSSDARDERELSETLRRSVLSGFSLALGGANVIMQLSNPAVGHGVIEGSVPSGSLYRHPLKRTRTTLSYIMIALLGTEHERDVMRREVNAQHRQVRSREHSTVAFNAFNPDLQLWVAACMYRGVEDVARLFGPGDESLLDELYAHSARFATTLQVSASRWPKDRASFENYWHHALRDVTLDDETRRYLYALASLDFLPLGLGRVLGPVHRFITAGFLAPFFRDALGLPWSPARQRLFDALVRLEVRLNAVAPRVLREFPWNFYLWEARRRIRRGRAIV